MILYKGNRWLARKNWAYSFFQPPYNPIKESTKRSRDRAIAAISRSIAATSLMQVVAATLWAMLASVKEKTRGLTTRALHPAS
jgi:hypothetical protein